MNGNEIMGLKNLKEHYKIKGVVSNYEKLRFFSLSGRVQHNREIFIINKIIEQINPKFLLEIAVGPGRITKDIKFPYNAVGVDSSEEMIIEAKKFCNEKWSFLVSDIMRMPFKKEMFDMIYTFRLIPHFKKDEREKSYKEIYRVLKNKGCFVMNIGNKSYKKPQIIKLLVDFYHIINPVKKQKYLPKVYNVNLTLNEIKGELEKNNFFVKKVYNTNYHNTLNLFLLVLAKSIKFLDKFAMNYLINSEDRNQHKLNKYAEFILVCEKNGKYKRT